MNPTYPSTPRDLVVDSLAIVFFGVVVVAGLMPATTGAAFVMAIVGGRLGLKALVARPASEASAESAAPAPSPAVAASSASSASSSPSTRPPAPPPPTSGVLFVLLGFWHLLEPLLTGRKG